MKKLLTVLLVVLLVLSLSACKPLIDGLSLSENEFSLLVGESKTITCELSLLPGASEDDVDVSWTSSDETVAVVSETGTVTAVGEGECQIVASADDFSASAAVVCYNLTEEEALIIGTHTGTFLVSQTGMKAVDTSLVLNPDRTGSFTNPCEGVTDFTWSYLTTKNDVHMYTVGANEHLIMYIADGSSSNMISFCFDGVLVNGQVENESAILTATME